MPLFLREKLASAAVRTHHIEEKILRSFVCLLIATSLSQTPKRDTMFCKVGAIIVLVLCTDATVNVNNFKA